jgi:Ca2+-binding EF-hand superfamily protein
MSRIRDSEADEIIATIRRRLDDYIGPGLVSSKRLKEVFADIDRNANNRIDRKELQQAMAILGVTLTNRDLNLIFDRFDADGTDDFDYREFLELIHQYNPTDLSNNEELIKETDDICAGIRQEIEKKHGTGFKKDIMLLDLFESYDRKKTGRIYRKELIELLQDKLQSKVSERSIDTVIERFDRRNSNDMDYSLFLNMISGKFHYQSIQEIMKVQTDEMIDLIYQQLEELFGTGVILERRIENALKEIDDKYITCKQLISVLLDDLKVKHITVREIEYLFQRFNTENQGKINYRKELLPLLSTGTSDKPKSPYRSGSSNVREILEAIRKALSDELGSSANIGSRLKEIFAAIDKNGNSRIEKSELQKCMEQLHLELSTYDLTLLMQRFDRDDSGNFDYNEFLQMFEG